MYQLVYISTRKGDFSVADREQVLSVSRRNNVRDGITGMLLYKGRRFLQALEGEESVVRRAFERIRQDPRHIAVVELSAAEVPAREFGMWSMAFEEPGSVGEARMLEQVDRLTERAGADTRAQFRNYAARKAA